MTLHLKFAQGADTADRRRVSRDARQAGVRSIRPMFPGRKGTSLGDLYVVELKDDAKEDVVLNELRGHAVVESVEPEIKRYLTLS